MPRQGNAGPSAASSITAGRSMPKSSYFGTSYTCLSIFIMTLAFVIAAFQFLIELHPDALPSQFVSEAGGGATNVAPALGRSGGAESIHKFRTAPEDTSGHVGDAPVHETAAGGNLSPPPKKSRNVTRIIWQTSRNSTLPAEANDYVRTWTDKNPGWEHRILSDLDMDDFFRNEFTNDPRVYDAFRSLPLGVMKADMFRVGVVYRRGGVYADIDTECVVPLDSWWPDEEKKGGTPNVGDREGDGGEEEEECGAYIGAEGSNLCNWALAAPRPGHPVFERALYRIVEGVESYGGRPIKVKRKGMVLAFTGPASLTRAVAEALGLEKIVGPGREMKRMHNGGLGPAGKDALSGGGMLEDEKALARAKEIKLCLKDKAFFARDKVKHHYGAMMWKDSALYKSWKQEIASLMS